MAAQLHMKGEMDKKKSNFTAAKHPPAPKYVSVYLDFSCLFAEGKQHE